MAATMEASTDFPLSVSFRSASDTAGRLLPGLSDDIALMCLALVPRGYWGVLKCVSKAWRGTLSSEDICTLRRLMKITESWLYVLAHGAGPTLQAYSPVLDRWFKFPWKANLAPGSMVGVGEHLVVVGGRASDRINPNAGEPEHPDFTSQVRLFNARTLAWFDGPPVPQAYPCLCSWSDGNRAFIGALTRASFHVLSSEVSGEVVQGAAFLEAPVDTNCGVLPSNKESSRTTNLRDQTSLCNQKGTVLGNWRTFAQGPVDVRDGEDQQLYNIASAHLTPFTMNGKQQVSIYNDSTSPSVIFEVDPEKGTCFRTEAHIYQQSMGVCFAAQVVGWTGSDCDSLSRALLESIDENTMDHPGLRSKGFAFLDDNLVAVGGVRYNIRSFDVTELHDFNVWSQEARGWLTGPPLPYGGGTIMAIAVLSI